MAVTNNLGITLVDASQAQKEVTINQGFALLDAFVGRSVVTRTLATPPSSPTASALYIVAASPTGAWAGKANYLAYFDQIWRFIAPQSGMRVWVQDESADYRYSGSAWAIVTAGSGSWGTITGTLSTQTDLQTALNAKAPLASPSFTGTVSGITAAMVGAPSGSGTSTGTNTGDQTITLTGEATGSGTGSFATTLSNSAVIGKVLTGYVSGAGTIAATDSILQAIQKLNGNDGLKAPLASPTFTGTVSGITAAMVGAPSGSGTSTGTNTGDQTITLTGEVTGSGTGSFATTVSNSAVIGKVLTGYVSGAGTVAATDSILQAIQKINGNDALKAPLASPTFTGTVTLPAGQVVNGVTLSTSAGTTNFLRGDGTYAAPAGGGSGTVTSVSVTTANGVSGTVATATTTPAITLTLGAITPSSISSSGTITSAAHTITSTSAAALIVGANGATNPALTVDASTASSATGVAIKSAAAAGGVSITATSSGTNEDITLVSKGTTSTASINGGAFAVLKAAGNPGLTCTQGAISMQTSFRGFTANPAFSFTGTTDSNLTASTEATSIDFNIAQVKTHSTGALTTQRDIRLRPSTHAFAAASTLTDMMGVSIDGAPVVGTNATVTNTYTLHSPGNAVGAATNSYAVWMSANTGATNNYIASLNGSAGEVMRIRTDGQVTLLNTVTAAGTNGAQTINKPSGTVNFAAAATSLVVTNSLCTTNSIILATVRTNDSTMKSVQAVPASGSFTLFANAAPTAATSVGFLIIN